MRGLELDEFGPADKTLRAVKVTRIVAAGVDSMATRSCRAPNHGVLRRQARSVLRWHHDAHRQIFEEETEGVVSCGDTWKLYEMPDTACHRQTEVGETFLERDGTIIPSQARIIHQRKQAQLNNMHEASIPSLLTLHVVSFCSCKTRAPPESMAT